MEVRGDHSAVIIRLEKELPEIRSLPKNAFISIIEGQGQLDDTSGRVDFSPCCMAFCKGLEIALFTVVFQRFRSEVSSLASFDEMIIQAASFEKANSITRFVSKGSPLELGTMAFTLNLCRGQTCEKMQLLSSLKGWILAHGFRELIEAVTADQIADIAKRFRNPAAHAETFSREQATEAKRLCFLHLKHHLAAHSELN
jgi:hypothetical protein